MKTYILDSINRFKRFSERLDVATTLSNKTWVVFNDSGERELYIFQPDGSVIITSNGIGVRGQWQWIAANQSLIIHHNDTVIMLHPQYIDNTILALNLDGTRETAFLIEDKNRESFAPKSLVQLEMYFENKEQKMLLEQRQQHQKKEQEQRRKHEQQKAEEERRRIEIQRERVEEERKQKEEKLKAEAIKLRNEITFSSSFNDFIWIMGAIGFIIGCWLAIHSGMHWSACMIFGPLAAFIFLLLPFIFRGTSQQKSDNKKIEDWKRKHPNDPRIKYL